MTEFQVYVYMESVGKSVVMEETIHAKTAKQAFTKACKVLYNTHSSRIRVERKNDPTSQ